MRTRARPSHVQLSIRLSLGLAMVGWAGTARGQASNVGTRGPDEFHLIITLGERPNSNVFFSAGSPQGDIISTLALGLTAGRHSPRTEWSLNYRPVLSHYLQYSELDSFSQAFGGTATYRLSERSRLLIAERFSLSTDPVIVAAPEDGESPILTNNTKRWRNNSGVDFSHDLRPSLSWATGVVYYANRFDDPGSVDNNGLIGNVGLNTKLGRDDTLSGNYSPGFVKFYSAPPAFSANPCADPGAPPQVIQAASQTEDSTAHSLGVNWSHTSGRAWEMDFSGGSSLVEQNGRNFTRTAVCQSGQVESQELHIVQGSRTSRLFVGRAGVIGKFLRFSVAGGYQRRLSADTGADTVTVADSLYANLNGNIGLRFTYGVGADYSTRKSLADATTAVNIVSEGIVVRGGYAVNDWFGLTAVANFRQQKNTGDTTSTQSVDNYFLGLTFKVF